VVGRFAVGGRPRLIRAVVTIGVSGSVVTLTPTGGISGAVSATRLGLPLRGLPFRLTFTSATVSSAGIVAAGTAHHVVLGS
jgi:hypothetical protein